MYVCILCNGLISFRMSDSTMLLWLRVIDYCNHLSCCHSSHLRNGEDGEDEDDEDEDGDEDADSDADQDEDEDDADEDDDEDAEEVELPDEPPEEPPSRRRLLGKQAPPAWYQR